MLLIITPDEVLMLCISSCCLGVLIYTRCSMRETRETALLHVACGKPARRRYCKHGCKVQSESLDIERVHFRRAILDLEQVAPLVDGGLQ